MVILDVTPGSVKSSSAGATRQWRWGEELGAPDDAFDLLD